MQEGYDMNNGYDGRVIYVPDQQGGHPREFFLPGRIGCEDIAESVMPPGLERNIVLYAGDKKGVPKKDGSGGGNRGNKGRGCGGDAGGKGRGGGQGGGKGRK